MKEFRKFTIINSPGFRVLNANSNSAAFLSDNGNIFLEGSCINQTTCSAPSNSFTLGNATDSITSYIDPQGNLCVEKGDCSDLSSNCNPTTNAFLIQNSTDGNMSYIDFDGNLCLTGRLYENSNP